MIDSDPRCARRLSGFVRKAALPLLVLSLALLAGCAVRYDVGLNNGMKYTNVTKPKFDKASGCYVFTDAFGKTRKVRDGNITMIEPHEDASKADSQFRNGSDMPKSSSR